MERKMRVLAAVIVTLLWGWGTAFAQNEFEHTVSFDKVVHDFGDIMISDGAQECRFVMKNISAAPVVIPRVLSSCGCTEPEWTKGPVSPGESAEIKVTFSNDQGPYPFNKSITVYVSGLSKPVILKIKGVAHDKPKSLSELYPVACGPLGFKEKTVSLGQIEQGLARSMELEFANTSSRAVEVSFRDMTPGLTVAIADGKIPARSKTRITCMVDTRKTDGTKWGKTPFTFTVVANGKSYPGITVEALLKENFSDLTETQKRAAALPQFEVSSIEFGSVEKGQALSGEFGFKNIGKQPFVIYKAYCDKGEMDISTVGEVAPGTRGTLTFSARAGQEPGEAMRILTLITNSPTRPIINLFVLYTVR